VTSYTVTASTGQTMTADEPNHWAIVPGLTDWQAPATVDGAPAAPGHVHRHRDEHGRRLGAVARLGAGHPRAGGCAA
jgi:hypothetical protein